VVKWVYDSVYYSASTVTAYILFKDEKWFPSELGGKNFEDTFSGFPNMPEVLNYGIYRIHGCPFII